MKGKEGEREAVRDVSSTCLLRKLHGAAAPPCSHSKGSLVRLAIVIRAHPDLGRRHEKDTTISKTRTLRNDGTD